MGVYVYKESTDELQKIAGLGLEVKDTQMSDTSTNAVQNKTIKSYVDTKVDNINVGIDTTNDEYERWKVLGQLKENTDYYIEDIGLDEYDAENMSFDNTRKQLGSSVQTAIETVDDKCIALNENKTSIPSGEYSFQGLWSNVNWGSSQFYATIPHKNNSNITIKNAYYMDGNASYPIAASVSASSVNDWQIQFSCSNSAAANKKARVDFVIS